MKLSICIPSIIDREDQLNALKEDLLGQVSACGAHDDVQLIPDVDNKEVSIGHKRNRMYQACRGEYAVQIDDDDRVSSQYVRMVLKATETGADCIGYRERCVIDGQIRFSSFSNQHGSWRTLPKPDRFGNTYYRTPFTKSPIKTSICQTVGVRDMRFGEDHDFARRVLPFLRSEYFIDEIMYHYTATTLTKKQHNERYGIK